MKDFYISNRDDIWKVEKRARGNSMDYFGVRNDRSTSYYLGTIFLQDEIDEDQFIQRAVDSYGSK